MIPQKKNCQDGITMIKGYETEILKMYDDIRNNNAKSLKKRKNEIQEKHPQILEIDNEIRKL